MILTRHFFNYHLLESANLQWLLLVILIYVITRIIIGMFCFNELNCYVLRNIFVKSLIHFVCVGLTWNALKRVLGAALLRILVLIFSSNYSTFFEIFFRLRKECFLQLYAFKNTNRLYKTNLIRTNKT